MQNSARRAGLGIEVHDSATNTRANEHADSVGDEGNQTLSGCAQCLRRFLVYVDLAGDEEKVVADSVKNDPQVEQTDQAPAVPGAEANVAQNPGEHAEH